MACECCGALWVKFTLTSALTQSAASATAKVYPQNGDEDEREFWQGENPAPGTATLTVYNLQVADETPVTYRFEGAIGDVGLATWDDVRERYQIVAMSAEPTIPSTIYGFLEDELEKGASATLAVWEKSGEDEGPNGETETVHDVLLCDGDSLDEGTKVIAAWHDNDSEYKVIAATCCPEESTQNFSMMPLLDAKPSGSGTPVSANDLQGAIDTSGASAGTFDFTMVPE